MAKLMSKGTLIEFSDDDFTTTHSLTCQLASWTGPGTTTETIESPDLCPDTPTEKTPGAISLEDFGVTGYFDPNDTAIVAAQEFDLLNTALDWRITWTDEAPATVTAFNGFINAFSVNGSTGSTVGLTIGVALSELDWIYVAP